MITVTFIKDNKEYSVKAENGISLLDVAIQNDIELVGNCGGACSCGTCHVIVDEKWISKVDPATTEEEDVLDIVFGITKNSRLGCQIFTKNELDGIVVTIPNE